MTASGVSPPRRCPLPSTASPTGRMSPVHRAGAVAAVLTLALASGCAGPFNGGESRELVGLQVLHLMAERSPEEHPVPATVNEHAWVWKSPGGSGIHGILPVPTGAVVRVDDGVVGLDTATGETAWSFRFWEHGTRADVALTPDRQRVAVAVDGAVVLLDSAIGAEVGVHEYEPDPHANGPGQLAIDGSAGLAVGEGLVSARAEEAGAINVTLTPWAFGGSDNGNGGWRSEVRACDEGISPARVEGGFTTPGGVVLLYGCGEPKSADDPAEDSGVSDLVALDIRSGEEVWRLATGEDFTVQHHQNSPRNGGHFAALGDVAVRQNLAPHQGTLVIDTETGEVVSDELPHMMGPLESDFVVRVLPDGYVALSGTGLSREGGLWGQYELRDFSGEVRGTVPTDTVQADGLLPLEDALVRLDWADPKDPHLLVFDWDGSAEPAAQVPVKVEVESGEVDSRTQAEAIVGPGTFVAVPGAVLLREYRHGQRQTRISGFTD